MSRSIIISWVLYAIRETLGLSSVRNQFLRNKIEKLGKFPKGSIRYGPTFTQGNTFDDIYVLISDFHGSDRRFLIFTSNGEIAKTRKRKQESMTESHYVSFVVDKQEMTIMIIDPSRNKRSVGIYNPYIGLCLEPFFKNEGYKVKWLDMTSPCQINYHDVFCQSWTLYLVYKYMKHGDGIYIPKKQNRKYRKLLNFFKSLLGYDLFQTELQSLYLESIQDHDDFNTLVMYNPCILLSEMVTEDMKDSEDNDSNKDRKYI